MVTKTAPVNITLSVLEINITIVNHQTELFSCAKSMDDTFFIFFQVMFRITRTCRMLFAQKTYVRVFV